MKIKSVKYVKSFVSVHDVELEPLPSIAFIGRSNVGKSSVINNLIGRKGLVKTSSTPGKTQLINFFLVNEKYYFVDLPGYGFAQVSAHRRREWETMIQEFLFQYPSLALILQLVDIRHAPGNHDKSFHGLLKRCPADVRVIANKVDKLKKNNIKKSVKIIEESMEMKDPIIFSVLKKIGYEKTWELIDQYLL